VVASDDVTPVGRTGATPAALELPEIAIEVELVCITLEEEEMGLDVEVEVVTTVVSRDEDLATETVKTWVIVVVTTIGFITPSQC
jgi:hypothetical protein